MEGEVENVVKKVIEKTSHFKTTLVKKPLDLALDEGNLLAIDSNPLEDSQLKSNKEKYLYDLNRDNVQVLFNKLWQLPVERVEGAVIATLPEPTTKIPREKPLPAPKGDTKWEAYAKLKGIQKKKKSRLVWDKAHKDYRPAWGYKRANDETKEWAIEVPHNADAYEDQFEKRIEARKERVAKNELQRLRNIARNSKGKLPGVGLAPVAIRTRDHVSKAFAIAKTSTASVGKFDEKLRKEDAVKQKRKKRKFESNTQEISTEREKQLDMLRMVTSARKKPALNVKVAMKQAKLDQLKDKIAQKKARKQMEEKMRPKSKREKKWARKSAQSKQSSGRKRPASKI